ncbi:MAG: phosphomannomutase/phosphoglucomutase [Bacteroidales bacterium]|nr:phosphomannomutase/phosphoglucomutase [Bacteroidales bacterium]
MVDYDWSVLQNGSEIRGIATNGVIGEYVTMTPEKVAALGRGFVQWIWQKTGKRNLRIAIGNDCRISGSTFVEMLEESISHTGSDVLNCGLASTPAVLVTTLLPDINVDGAIMLTGGHLPFNRNGMKFFFQGVDVSKDELSEIIVLASAPYTSDSPKGQIHIFNLLAVYSKRLRGMIVDGLKGSAANPDRPLEGLKIVVDAANGSGGFFATRVLRPLGADVSASQFLRPDGWFPNHSPNPEDYEATRSLATAVRYSNADMGILFDAEVDRMTLVDDAGRIISRNKLVAMASAIVLEEHPDTTIVTDSITSTGLGVFITNILKGHHHRFQRGYRNVINEAKRLNNEGHECWLAVETSGHAAFGDNNFIDDGAYLAVRFVIKLAQLKQQGKSIYSLIEQLPEPVESKEVRLRINDSDFSRVASDTLSGLRQFVSQIPGWEEVSQNFEGLRVMCNNDDEKGWFLFRLSLHEPELPINIESDVRGGTAVIIRKLKLFFRNLRSIDSSALY